jgi:hypothetical protein
VNFLIFCSVWSILTVAFLVLSPRYDADGRHVGHKLTILAVEAVTAIFWFAGFIALVMFVQRRRQLWRLGHSFGVFSHCLN